jgi:hypothetical protein
MLRRERALLLMALVLIGTAVVACTGPRTVKSLPSTPVSIADFNAVAGVWEGLLRGLPGTRSEEDWVRMEVGGDGSCSFATVRPIGVFQGSGTLRLSDGRLYLQAEEGGSATFTLYEGDGRRLLRADAIDRTGNRLTADLTPER